MCVMYNLFDLFCVFFHIVLFLFPSRHRHNNEGCGIITTEGLCILDRETSFLLLAYNRPHHSKYKDYPANSNHQL